jgi:hypothetical protein
LQLEEVAPLNGSGWFAPPTLYRGKGDDDNALAPFALQFQSLSTDFGDQLPALTARLKSLIAFQRGRLRDYHDIRTINLN